MYCTLCCSSDDVCSCDEPELTYAGYCENCGSIDSEESLDSNDGFCEDCEDAREEYRDSVVSYIVENIDLVL